MDQNNLPSVVFGSYSGSELLDFASDAELFTRLDADSGKWFVVADFEGRIRGWKFKTAPVTAAASMIHTPTLAKQWRGPAVSAWRSSLDAASYQEAVARTRECIAAGGVYQANICRVLSAQLPTAPHPAALAAVFAAGNPAPFLGYIHVAAPSQPAANIWLTSASPELFLEITRDAAGKLTAKSSPIKGTARKASGITPKDAAENTMITDLMRNDLSRLAVPGTVAVRDFLHLEEHPGLVHLVSTVTAELPANAALQPGYWREVFALTFPPGSVSGAPKKAALDLITALEPHHRGPYCGAFGWVDAASGEAELAVGIRSFWWEQNCPQCGPSTLHFGTGAGITWGSDPAREWQETELKAHRLIALATSGSAA